MSEVIVVTSGKGGVGKTTTSANVGTGLAKSILISVLEIWMLLWDLKTESSTIS